MRRSVLIAALALGCCAKAPAHVAPPPEDPGDVSSRGDLANDTATSEKFDHWTVSLVCPDGSYVYLLPNGHLALFQAGATPKDYGHWDELSPGAPASAGCKGGATNSTEEAPL